GQILRNRRSGIDGGRACTNAALFFIIGLGLNQLHLLLQLGLGPAAYSLVLYRLAQEIRTICFLLYFLSSYRYYIIIFDRFDKFDRFEPSKRHRLRQGYYVWRSGGRA